jgi:cytidyltransferase-like protein
MAKRRTEIFKGCRFLVKTFKTGVVIGKFYPPHKGHHFLIDTALSQCEMVFVFICWKPSQTVPIQIRTACMREMHPQTHILEVEDILADDDTSGWAAYTIRRLGFQPEAVFSSEDYGDAYAQAMGARHVMVDRKRVQIPCSGTMIRSNPFWNGSLDRSGPFMLNESVSSERNQRGRQRLRNSLPGTTGRIGCRNTAESIALKNGKTEL